MKSPSLLRLGFKVRCWLSAITVIRRSFPFDYARTYRGQKHPLWRPHFLGPFRSPSGVVSWWEISIKFFTQLALSLDIPLISAALLISGI